MENNFEIIIDIAYTQYDIIPYVATNIFNWRISDDDEEEWDICWMDTGVTADILADMKLFQRINHFPGMNVITRKDNLALHLNAARDIYPIEYNFYPQTWVLPRDSSSLKRQFNKKRAKTFIVKPEASCQGRGIFLTRHIEEIPERCVVQRYVHKPMLLDGLKFDLRLYVLVSGCDPLRIYLHKEGLVRLATQPYTPPKPSNLSDAWRHLTNYAINKNNPGFIYNTSSDQSDTGHKRSVSSFLTRLQSEGHDVGKLWGKIKSLIIKTLIVAQPHVRHVYRSAQAYDLANCMCFEILGFDVMMDYKGKPILLEVNHTPSFTTDTPLDRTVKQAVISDALSLIDIKPGNREKYYEKIHEKIAKRSTKSNKEMIQFREYIKQKTNKRRAELENEHQGGFEKIYPINGTEEYDYLFEGNQNAWKSLAGIKPKQQKKVNSPPLNVQNSTVKQIKTEDNLRSQNSVEPRTPITSYSRGQARMDTKRPQLLENYYNDQAKTKRIIQSNIAQRPIRAQQQPANIKTSLCTRIKAPSPSTMLNINSTPSRHLSSGSLHVSRVVRNYEARGYNQSSPNGVYIKPKNLALNLPSIQKDDGRKREALKIGGRDVIKLY